MEADSPLLQGGPIHAIYFGGGTPSALSAQQLHSIISQLRKSLPLAPDCEITVEGRILILMMRELMPVWKQGLTVSLSGFKRLTPAFVNEWAAKLTAIRRFVF